MLKAKELRFKGIGRFVEEQVVNFENLGKLVQVDGQNNNTKGSSGAGKSTVFNALDYLLGLNDLPVTVLASRLTDEGPWAQGIFDFNGKPLKIIRGKKLSIELDGIETKGSSKIAEEKLDEILSIPRSMFRKMLHKRQKEGGFFLGLAPKETNDFLMDCLDLGNFKLKIDKISLKTDELSKKKIAGIGYMESASSALKATKDAVTSLGNPPEKDVDQNLIVSLKEKADSSSQALLRLQNAQKLEAEQLEKERPNISVTPFDASVKEGYDKERKALEKEKETLLLAEKDRQAEIKTKISDTKDRFHVLINRTANSKKAEQEAPSIALEVKKIRESICPTCEQNWQNDSSKMKENELLLKLKSLKDVIEIGRKAKEELLQLNLEIDKLNILKEPMIPAPMQELEGKISNLSELILEEKGKERSHRESQNEQNNRLLDDFSLKQRSIREKHSKELSQVTGQADLDRRALEASIGKFKSYNEAKARYERSFDSLKAQEAHYKQTMADIEVELTKISLELEMAEELKRGIKSYLSCSFDEALETIGDTATKIIRNIPNMANATVQLEGVKETKEGKMKEEVNAVIHMDGDESIPIKSLCGGERSAIDLAVDLSVIDYIESKTGKGADIFILDEPFTGLDTVCIEMALEVLKNSNTGKRLILVDHNPEVKQMVESRLTVVRDGVTSSIVQ